MSKEKLLPKLRFEEFSSVWEKRTLGEVANVAMNKRIFKNQTSKNGEVPFYKIGTFGKKPDAYISRELFDEYKSKYPYPRIGDILISASGSIGRTVEYKGGDEYFQDSNIVWLNHNGKIDNHFLKQFYKIVTWHGLEGSTIKRLYNSNILNTEIILPTLEEQEKIGRFFKKFDKMIQLQQSKVNKVKDIKSAYLSEMFPKEGEKYPKKRFEGFKEPWKEYSLGEVGNLYQPQTISRTSLQSSGIPVFGANGYIGYYSNANHEKDQITISARGENAGNPSYVVGPVWITGNSMVVNVDENTNINKKYLYSYLSSQRLEKYITGGAQPQLTRDVLNKVPIQVPSFLEQEKIGQFFKNLDNQISIEEEKLAKLEKLKQSYLNDMFV